MPRELTAAEESAYNRYQAFGTPDEIETQIKKLRKEAAKYRTRASELESAAESAPQVPEGGRVLTKDEAEAFAAFEALKLKPEAIQAVVTERDQLKEGIAQRDREAAREAAARALGIEGKDLAPFAGADALTYEVREVEENGEKKPAAFVKDADGNEAPLADYGREKWGRPFEAVLDAASGAVHARATQGASYTPQTGTPPARREGKVTPEQQRAATRRTVNMGI